MALTGVDREGIMAALFTRLSAISGITKAERKFRDVPDVDAREMPWLGLVDGDEHPSYSQEGIPAKWEIDPVVFLYFQNDGTTGSTVLNTLLTAIETALLWQAGDGPFAVGAPGGLGGRCTHARISEIRKGMGAKSGQGVAVIHLHILVAGKN